VFVALILSFRKESHHELQKICTPHIAGEVKEEMQVSMAAWDGELEDEDKDGIQHNGQWEMDQTDVRDTDAGQAAH
jgi:hypothetical protein